MPTVKKSVYHSHYLPRWRIPKNKPIIFLVRDGRDVIISKYFHQLVWNEKNKFRPKNVFYHRSKVPFENYENIKENIYDFIKYDFENRPSKFQQFTYMGNWVEYNTAWLIEMERNENIFMIKYEELLKDTQLALHKLLENAFGLNLKQEKIQAIVDQYSFEKQAKRKSGVEDKKSFLRKGISGDWKNYFGEKEKRLYKKYAAQLLIDLGYEHDDNW